MAVFNLNLNGDYSKQLLSYYIWGQDTQPPVGKSSILINITAIK
ncbi:hypothetical protein [uncultured Campylobacter sp.]|nr:hypothetical protein [uncultured Campylobacter sp.]